MVSTVQDIIPARQMDNIYGWLPEDFVQNNFVTIPKVPKTRESGS